MIDDDLTLKGAKAAILAAAGLVFFRYGYAKATMSEIAAKAGLKKPSLYYYFPTKEDLFRAVIESKRADFRAGVENILTANTSARERIARYTLVRFEYFRALQALSIADFSVATRNRPVLNEMFQRHAQEESGWLARLFADGKKRGEFEIQSSARVAETFLHIQQGLRLRYMRDAENPRGETPSVDQFKRELLAVAEIFLNGIQNGDFNHTMQRESQAGT